MPREKPQKASAPPEDKRLIIERVQTGVRIEKRILRVLKALAEYHDMTLGDLLEGIVLHAFEGKAPFGDDTQRRIAELKKVYDLDLDSGASHRLIEKEQLNRSARSARSPSATPPPAAAARAPRRPPSSAGK